VKVVTYIGGLVGLALLIVLVVRADFSAMLGTFKSGGWMLLWLIPYRAVFFLLYTLGWTTLLRPYDPRHRAGIGYVFWATTVRDAIDRLLPVASVGGSLAGVRLLRWRGIAAAPAGATVIVEIVLTLIVVYLFTALGLLLLAALSTTGQEYHRLLLAFVISLPVPVVTFLLLRHGSVFARLQRFLGPMVGESLMAEEAPLLDRELHAALRRRGRLLAAGALQFAALASGSFEVWFALRLFGHPVGAAVAIVLESMTQAVRHLAFVVPAGLGVQEAGLILFGHAFGVSSELALAVSMAKRIREVLCALPSLVSWQWMEGRRLHAPTGSAN
jgi:putative membrane protein